MKKMLVEKARVRKRTEYFSRPVLLTSYENADLLCYGGNYMYIRTDQITVIN